MTTENMFNYKILAKDTKTNARAGRITTAHGTINTPALVAVGTRATVRGLTPQDLKEVGVQIFFGNTYHLHLRPGEDIVEKFGGLGKFMGWNGPTMTDSGGFQVFSLGREKSRKNNTKDAKNESGDDPRIDRQESAPLVKITEDGVLFRSHLDGTLHTFTPEKSIEIQQKLGADIILVLDECAPHPSSHKYTREAMERTHSWAKRCLSHHSTFEESFHNTSKVTKGLLRGGQRQALFGIIQGGVYKDLREESARFISSLAMSPSTSPCTRRCGASLGINSVEGFDGIAIGGVAVGESKKEMRDVLDWVLPFLPDEKPRHLLGVGEVDDIFEIIERGIDTFDCVIPTRLGRTGFIFVAAPEGNIKNRFRIDINKSKFSKDQRPLSKDCKCYVCSSFTRGYVHHLFRVQELLAYRLASYHNLYFINSLVAKIRETILEGRFGELKKEWMQ